MYTLFKSICFILILTIGLYFPFPFNIKDQNPEAKVNSHELSLTNLSATSTNYPIGIGQTQLIPSFNFYPANNPPVFCIFIEQRADGVQIPWLSLMEGGRCLPLTQCNDGIDNDNDGFTDFGGDQQCTSELDGSEEPGGVDEDSTFSNVIYYASMIELTQYPELDGVFDDPILTTEEQVLIRTKMIERFQTLQYEILSEIGSVVELQALSSDSGDQTPFLSTPDDSNTEIPLPPGGTPGGNNNNGTPTPEECEQIADEGVELPPGCIREHGPPTCPPEYEEGPLGDDGIPDYCSFCPPSPYEGDSIQEGASPNFGGPYPETFLVISKTLIDFETAALAQSFTTGDSNYVAGQSYQSQSSEQLIVWGSTPPLPGEPEIRRCASSYNMDGTAESCSENNPCADESACISHQWEYFMTGEGFIIGFETAELESLMPETLVYQNGIASVLTITWGWGWGGIQSIFQGLGGALLGSFGGWGGLIGLVIVTGLLFSVYLVCQMVQNKNWELPHDTEWVDEATLLVFAFALDPCMDCAIFSCLIFDNVYELETCVNDCVLSFGYTCGCDNVC